MPIERKEYPHNILHENIPQMGFFSTSRDGVWLVKRAAIAFGEEIKTRMDMMVTRLRSPEKKQKGFPSGDQMMYGWLTPTKLVVGVMDGIYAPFTATAKASELFPPAELAEHQRNYGEILEDRLIPSDSFAAILVAKMFPLSGIWEDLARKPDITAREVLLAADEYVRDVYAANGLSALSAEERPGVVASIALIDFKKEMITTAHIGDTYISYENWDPALRKDCWDAAARVRNQSLHRPITHDFDIALYAKMMREGIERGSQKYFWELLESYREKRNKPGGIGVLNGDLNPDLIEDRTIPLDEVFSLFLHTDGLDTGDVGGNLNLAHRIMNHPEIAFPTLEAMQYIAQICDLYPLIKEDDALSLLISFAHSPHTHSKDRAGKKAFLDWRQTGPSSLSLTGWSFNPRTSRLTKKYVSGAGLASEGAGDGFLRIYSLEPSTGGRGGLVLEDHMAGLGSYRCKPLRPTPIYTYP